MSCNVLRTSHHSWGRLVPPQKKMVTSLGMLWNMLPLTLCPSAGLVPGLCVADLAHHMDGL